MSAQSAPAPPKLPILKSVYEAYDLAGANLASFIKLAWLPLILLIFGLAALYWMLWPLQQAAMSENDMSSNTLLLADVFLSTLIGSSIAVGWHRRLLVSERVTSFLNLRLDAVVLHYFAWALVITLVCVVPVIALNYLIGMAENSSAQNQSSWDFAIFAVIFAMFVIWFFAARASVFLPGIALQHPVTLKQAWQRTYANTWRIFGGTLLTTLPLILALFFLLSVSESYGLEKFREGYVVESCLSGLLSAIVGIFALTFLSVAYRHFFGPFGSSTQA